MIRVSLMKHGMAYQQGLYDDPVKMIKSTLLWKSVFKNDIIRQLSAG